MRDAETVIPWLIEAEQTWPGDMRPFGKDGITCPNLQP
jgi:hypothetical protein